MTYESRRQPRAKQREALDKMRGKPAFALRMGMRVGKSKVLVDDFGEMIDRDQASDLLLMAPGGVYHTWVDNIKKDMPDDFLRRVMMLEWDSGGSRGKKFQIQRDNFMGFEGPRALLINMEAISSVPAARELCLKFARQRPGRNVGAVDESVIIKNSDSTCGEFVVEELAPLFAWRRILTGLIAPRSPLDLWNQFRFLDPKILGHDTFASFSARYSRVKKVCMIPGGVLRGMLRDRVGLGAYATDSELRVKCARMTPDLNVNKMSRGEMTEYLRTMVEVMPRDAVIDALGRFGKYVPVVPIVEEYLDVEELADKIEPHSFRCRLEDCYDMPPSDWSFWDVPWDPEQRRIYESVRDTATAELAGMEYVTASHVIVRMLRLHQILCGHVVNEDKVVREVPERRTAELVKLLEDYDGKAIVWCSYDHSIKRVQEALEKNFGEGSVSRFWGGNVKTREREENEFNNDAKKKFMLATPDAGGRGRDWSVADLCVFYSSRNNLDHRAQAEDRPKADGKMRPIAYVDMRVRGTVEDGITWALREKMDIAAVIDRDGWKRWVV